MIQNISKELKIVKGLKFLQINDDSLYMKWSTLINLVMEFLLCGILNFIGIFLLKSHLCLITKLILFLSSLIQVLFECQFILYNYLLYAQFSNVNLLLIQPTNSSIFKKVNITITNLQNIRKRHEKICIASSYINNYFCVQILMVITLNFLVFLKYLFSSYNKMLQFKHNEILNTQEIISEVIILLNILLRLFLICYVPSLMKKFANESIQILFELNNTYDEIIGDEIEIFEQQIQAWNVNSSACGFFNIDMTLFFNVRN
nr:putative gustatory receptor 28b [Onthophagus taurus]